MESIITPANNEKENNQNILEGLRSELYARLKEQGRIGNVPLSEIAKELETYPTVSFLYDSKTINHTDQLDREGKFMDVESEDFKHILGFIHGSQKEIPEQKKSNYLTFEKKDDGMVVNLVKIEPSNGKGFVWVKKLTVKEFADFAHRHN